MKVIVVYESHYGNTAAVAKAIAQGFGPDAQALLGHPASYFVTRALLWTVGIVAVFLPLAVAKYRRG